MLNRVSFCVCLLCVALVNAKSNRIVGGDDASTGQFKYQISLLEKNKNVCGGAIIGDQHILTAAHCVVEPDGKFNLNNYKVVAGSTNLLTDEGVRIDVEKMYVPKTFSPEDLSDDIAVLKLQKGLGLGSNPNIDTISLPSREWSYVDYTAVMAGFGFNSIRVRTNPETGQREQFNGRSDKKLKYCMVDIISNLECTRRNGGKIFENQICGRAVQRGRQGSGICMGDSGGPLVLGNLVIGVASTCPIGCTEQERASIYTDVWYFTGFIKQAMKDTTTRDMLVHEIGRGDCSSSSQEHGRCRWPC